jgi:hypothetical protein
MGDLFLTGKERSVQDRSEEANVGGVVSHLPTSFQPLINLFFQKNGGEPTSSPGPLRKDAKGS